MSTVLINSFNVGTDLSLTIVARATGTNVVLDGKKTNFTIKAKDSVIASAPIDAGGVPDHRVVPNGWNGSIEVDRSSDDFSALITALEAAYFQGGQQQYYTITCTVQRPDGSGTYRYSAQNAVFHAYDFGSFSKESRVMVKVDFDAAIFSKLS